MTTCVMELDFIGIIIMIFFWTGVGYIISRLFKLIGFCIDWFYNVNILLKGKKK